MSELNELRLKLGNAKMASRYAPDNDLELLAVDEVLSIENQINNLYKRAKLTGEKGAVAVGVVAETGRHWTMRSSVDIRL